MFFRKILASGRLFGDLGGVSLLSPFFTPLLKMPRTKVGCGLTSKARISQHPLRAPRRWDGVCIPSYSGLLALMCTVVQAPKRPRAREWAHEDGWDVSLPLPRDRCDCELSAQSSKLSFFVPEVPSGGS